MRYTAIAHSLVARHPNPVGVVEFYGGQFFGQFPATSYDALLERVFTAGYTIIAVPYAFSFDHISVAEDLLVERDLVRQQLPELDGVPHFWVGHSLGCKYIALLEAYTDVASGLFLPPQRNPAQARRGIIDEPSILMAPDIGDTASALPVPWLGHLLDSLGLGVRPTRAETQRLIVEDDLFNLTGLISFCDDTVAGHAGGDPAESDVAWLISVLDGQHGHKLIHRELPGAHMVPVGVRLADIVVRVDPTLEIGPAEPPSELERAVVEMLNALDQRRQRVIAQRKAGRNRAHSGS
ncbi:DUF1350 family protein [Candidatus Oscillochloris fontis]|uniref:DUF1350 family protein n=1 Tax=Candidatus Oscillochloris fontis TaxID=2496868 RepID=UPI00101BE051|nr:DUF1350 family protein [Candidatus Oscillochloris fontis]